MRVWRDLFLTVFLAFGFVAVLAPPVSATESPSAPQNIRLSPGDDKHHDRLTLRFDPPANTGGARITEYRVRFEGDTYGVGKKRDLQISGLDNGIYQVEVSARNRHGWGDWGTSNVARIDSPTDKRVPSEVRSLKVDVDDDGNIALKWKEPKNGDVDGYVVRVAPGFERRLGPDQLSTMLQGFNTGDYEIFVSAVNQYGESKSKKAKATVAGPPAVRVGPFPSPQQFVGQQYRDLFAREADTDGAQFWAGQLNGQGSNAPQVIDSMMGAPEFLPSYQSIRLYLAYFNRLPDNEGLNYWVDVLKTEQAELSSVSDAFSASAEFNNTYGALSNADFVALVYNNVLLRRPDSEGLGYWVGQLARGLSRGEMMILFSDSAEFVNNSNPAVQTAAIYNSLLDRSPTPDEFQRWLAHIGANPSDRLALIQEIFASGAYRNRIS